MAVAVDATMTGGNDASGTCQSGNLVTTISSTGITVGASATLLVCLLILQPGGSSNPTSITATWNSVSMTKQANVLSGSGNNAALAYIFTLVSPASGAKTLTTSWTNSGVGYMSAISFTGTDTSTGVKTADNTTATNTTSLTVTSDSNGASVAAFLSSNGSGPTINFTTIFNGSDLTPAGGASYHLGGTSNAHTFTGSGGTDQALAGVHVITPAASNTAFEDDSYGINPIQIIDPVVSVW